MFTKEKSEILMLTTLCLAGCRGEANDAKLIAQIRGNSPTLARLQDRRPDLEVTVTEAQGPKFQININRFRSLRAQATLENGDNLIYEGTYEIDSDGNALTDKGPTRSTYLLWRPGYQTVYLSADEFERLVDATDVKTALDELGIDFERGRVDATKVVSDLGQTSSQVEKVHALSPKTRSTVDVPSYRYQATLILTVPLGVGFELTATWQIRLLRGGGFVELLENSDPTFLLSKANSADAAEKLTTEHIESLLNSTDPAQAAEAIWNGWHR